MKELMDTCVNETIKLVMEQVEQVLRAKKRRIKVDTPVNHTLMPRSKRMVRTCSSSEDLRHRPTYEKKSKKVSTSNTSHCVGRTLTRCQLSLHVSQYLADSS